MSTSQYKNLKKTLQKELLDAYSKGQRILDFLLEYQRVHGLEPEEIKKLVTKTVRTKMFEQEKQYKTVLTKATRHLVSKRKIQKITLDE